MLADDLICVTFNLVLVKSSRVIIINIFSLFSFRNHGPLATIVTMSDTGANKAQQLKSSVNQSVLEKIDIKKEKPDDYTTWENRENQVPNAGESPLSKKQDGINCDMNIEEHCRSDDADADDTKATPSTSKGRAEKQKVPIKKIRPMKVCIVDVLENNDIVLRKDVDETGGPTTTADGRVEIGVRK